MSKIIFLGWREGPRPSWGCALTLSVFEPANNLRDLSAVADICKVK